MQAMREALGVDVGGVIIQRRGGLSDTSFARRVFLETPAIPGALEALRRLVSERFGGRVYLVSKCGPRIQVKTLRWLKHHRFHEATGVKPRHVFFCEERRDKAGVRARLHITHFVDDRLEVLEYLRGIVEHRYLMDFQPWSEAGPVTIPKHVRRVESWQELLRELLGT
jgi:hypothetical protein